MNRTLITGTTGFVGTALCQTFRERGIEFVAATRHKIQPPPGCVRQIGVGPICHNTDWTDALSGVDAVVHLANRAHVMHDTSPVDPLVQYRAVNTAGTLNLARQAAERGIKRFVFASTIKVNGEGRAMPYSETDQPAPQNAYAISKWEAEHGLREIAAKTGLEVVILRIPLVYGPGVGANFLRLIQLVGRGVPLPFGCIENRRSLIYLGNLADVIALCLTHSAAANKTFLVSDGEDVSTPELTRRLAKALDCPSRILPVPKSWLRLAGTLAGKSKEIDRLMGSLYADSSAVRHDMGWSPPFPMEEGLAETTKWYRVQHGNGK